MTGWFQKSFADMMAGEGYYEDAYDDGEAKPTEEAVAFLMHLWPDADVPPGYMAPDDGGISIEWRRGRRDLRLRIPPNDSKNAYLYHQEGEEHGVVRPVTPEDFRWWAEWYAGGLESG